jgi:prepilin-type N-terminal cleavage/methylation domain-containing protein
MSKYTLQSGFTLLEIIVVVGLIGVIALLFMSSFTDSVREASLDSTYASVITALESARSKSISGVGTETHGVRISTTTIGVFTGSDYLNPYYTIELSPSISITNTSETIVFERISGKSAAAESVTLTDSQGNTRSINISSEGYVY